MTKYHPLIRFNIKPDEEPPEDAENKKRIARLRKEKRELEKKLINIKNQLKRLEK